MEKSIQDAKTSAAKSEKELKAKVGGLEEAQAQTESARALPEHETSYGSPGARPSNTAPANCNSCDSRVLRSGVDSLYLSFSGRLFERAEKQLAELKSLAQSETIEEKARAILELEDHRFSVLPFGAARFPFVLKDSGINIRLSSSNSTRLPLATVQISSELLTLSGLDEPAAHLRGIVREFGEITRVTPSRVDICCDFVTDVGFGGLGDEYWISRSDLRTRYVESGEFTGIVFGQGSDFSARLYDKSRQVEKSKQYYLTDLWHEQGWDGESTVWRLEFQVRRSVLREMGLIDYEDLRQNLQSIWHYATKSWLRLVVPGRDKTRARWPNHPLWGVLHLASIGSDPARPLKRDDFKQVPNDIYFYRTVASVITSFMAAREIRTFREAWTRLHGEFVDFHDKRLTHTGEAMESFLQKRAALKARDYSTRFPFTELGKQKDYRKERGK